jgi:hypothetical protein
MTPHREWFCKYEQYEGGKVFLGDKYTTKIIKRGRVRLLLQDGRSRTLPCMRHILGLEGNLIFLNKMSDVGVHTLFYKDSCNMVRGAKVLMKIFYIGALYNLLESVDSTGCNNIVVLEVKSNSNHLDLNQAESIQTNLKSHHKFD